MLCIWLLRNDVLSASCTCIAEKGEACSHIVALMFYLEDFMRQDHSDLPTDTAATDHLQQWHVPPKCDVSAQPVEGIKIWKAEYGKVVHWSFGHRYCLYPIDDKSNYDQAQAQQLVSTLCAVLSRSVFRCHANVSRRHTELHCRCEISSFSIVPRILHCHHQLLRYLQLMLTVNISERSFASRKRPR